jgi:hypothetical protein
MAIQYCAPVECSSCAGIGEVLDDRGIRTCKHCRGVGSTRVQCAREDIEQLEELINQMRLHRPDWILPVVMSVVASILALVFSVWALLVRSA